METMLRTGSGVYRVFVSRLAAAAAASVLIAACSSSTEPGNESVSCAARAPLNTGAPVNGNLATTDCQIGGMFADNFSWTATANQAVSITMSSTAFDALLRVANEAGTTPIAENDDESGSSQNARIKLIAAAGVHTVTATSFGQGETGGYLLNVANTSASAENCEEVHAGLGVTVPQTLSTTDCQLFAPFFDDQFIVYIPNNTRVRITMRSSVVDSWLELYAPSGDFLADDDDSGGNTATCGVQGPASSACDAQIVITVPSGGYHLISASSANVGETGAYTITIETAPAGAQPVGQFQRGPTDGRSVRKRGSLQ